MLAARHFGTDFTHGPLTTSQLGLVSIGCSIVATCCENLWRVILFRWRHTDNYPLYCLVVVSIMLYSLKQNRGSLSVWRVTREQGYTPQGNSLRIQGLTHRTLAMLSYKVKTQYVQKSNITDTSMKHPISGQFTLVVKGCMVICLIW